MRPRVGSLAYLGPVEATNADGLVDRPVHGGRDQGEHVINRAHDQSPESPERVPNLPYRSSSGEEVCVCVVAAR